MTLLVGCRTAGAACNTTDYGCEDGKTAVECRDGVWRDLPCKGPGGCESSGGYVTCDLTGDAEGDACGDGQEGQGICATVGGVAETLECRDGLLVKTNSCPTQCSGDGTHLSCT